MGSKTERESEIARLLVREAVLEEKKVHCLKPLLEPPVEEVKDADLRKLGEAVYELRKVKGKLNMLTDTHRRKTRGD